jgi:signal transduction histidine kinase
MANYEATQHNQRGEELQVRLCAEVIQLKDEACALVLAIDETERKRAELALRESRARLAEAQRIGHVGSWVLELASGTMAWSEELYRIYERDPRTCAGTLEEMLDRAHPDDAEPLATVLLNQAGGPVGAYEHQHRIVLAGGRIKTLHSRWEISRDASGKLLRVLGTSQDISPQEQAREEIKRFNAELEKRVQARTAELTAANRELESFAYSISHDLRSPLRGIDGFSHLLLERYRDQLDAQGRDYLARVRGAAQRMGALIDDILELSRVTRQEMRRERVDLSALAAELVEEMGQANSGPRPLTEIAPGCVVDGDPQLLKLLLQNLLENSWKYSARCAAPTIAFGCAAVDGKTVFHVRDNGVGFDEQFVGRLFAPFQRLHKPDDFEGNGIGLATVARIVRRHGGQVWAESKPGVATTFHFTLG